MKYKLLSLFLICILSYACSDNDDKNKTSEDSEIKEWIYDKMKTNYLWEVPSNPDYSSDISVTNFFKSLLSTEDGKTNDEGDHAYYSYIEDLSLSTRSFIKTDYSYGFEFTAYLSSEPYPVIALVNYVLEDSPASEAGLKRGDWIFLKDNKSITKSNYTTLQGDGACEFTIFRPTEQGQLKQEKTIEMGAARAVEDNPVYTYDFTLKTLNGKNVGYLVYNSFTAGKSNSDSSYDNELETLASKFNKGAKDFVLDLRYNNGGLVTSAKLLCNILCPADKLGEPLYYLKYRDGSTTDMYKLDLGSNINLDIENLYVLTTSNTASASEMVINCLRPYMNVVVIGDITEGKNVGSVTYISSDKNWEMHPIVCRIYNSEGFTDYADGIEPDYYINEAIGDNSFIYTLKDLGDPEERMLAATLKLIDGDDSAFDNTTRSVSKQAGLAPLYHSISRKATNGVIVE